MASFTPDDASGLRTAIQNATSGSTVLLTTGQTYSSITTLAKFTCYTPLTRTSNYTISGDSAVSNPVRTATIQNTRIYQENIDGPFGPTGVKNLTLSYSAGDGNAILRATKGTYTLDNLLITGTHAGWQGNGGVYMSLSSFDPSTTTTSSFANLTLTKSTISISGQNGTASFLQSWNNRGTVVLGSIGNASLGNTFNESGYSRGSFHFATMPYSGTKRGTYTVGYNTFIGDGTVRANSNRLESVNATIQSNNFQNGSYLDLAGNISTISINMNNFDTISGGPGIRFTQKSSSTASLAGMIPISSFLANTFTGYGLAIVNDDSGINTTSTVSISGNSSSSVTAGALGPADFTNFKAGGRFADTISDSVGEANWISGGAGNDTINADIGADWIIGGDGSDTIDVGSDTDNDTLLYYSPGEGGDTITNFNSADDRFAFRSSTFGNIATGTLTGANFSSNSGDITSVPTFLYTGGVLTYDADGLNTGNAGVTIATLTGSPSVAPTNIIIF